MTFKLQGGDRAVKEPKFVETKFPQITPYSKILIPIHYGDTQSKHYKNYTKAYPKKHYSDITKTFK